MGTLLQQAVCGAEVKQGHMEEKEEMDFIYFILLSF